MQGGGNNNERIKKALILETIKILEKNTGSNLFDIGLSNIFLDMSPWARKTKTNY